MRRILALALVSAVFAASIVGCSSAQYKKQGYAKLSNTKEFEEEYPVVWKGVLNAVSDYKLEEKNEGKGVVRTDWIYTTSNEKYHEYKVNGFPRKKYLQSRYKMLVKLQKQVGSVKVTVTPEEEIEQLRSDGSFDDWKSVSDPDAGRANELLRNIELKILSRNE